MNFEDIDNDPTLTPRQKYRKKEYWANVEANREASRRWSRENKSRAKESQRRWEKANPERNRQLKVASSRRQREKRGEIIKERRNTPMAKEKEKRYRRDKYIVFKTEVIYAYGGVCACCGESKIEFLCIDHINNNGGDLRRDRKHGLGGNFYRQLQKQGFPKGELQVLCWNCNLGKHYYGVCPHQQETDFSKVVKIA